MSLREKLAHALWLREAERVGPPSTIAGRTPEAFRDSSADNQERWLHYADAVLSVLGSLVEDEEMVRRVNDDLDLVHCDIDASKAADRILARFRALIEKNAALRALTEQSNDRT